LAINKTKKFSSSAVSKIFNGKIQWENENLSICWRKEIQIVAELTKSLTLSSEAHSGSACGSGVELINTRLNGMEDFCCSLGKGGDLN
jgi:hypothetical protein